MNFYLKYFSASSLTISMPLILTALRSQAAAARIDFVDINQFQLLMMSHQSTQSSKVIQSC